MSACMELYGLATSLSRGKNRRRNNSERLVTLGTLGRWLDRILSSRHPFTENQYPIIYLERTTIQQSEALRCLLTMTDSSFDETVDNNPSFLKMEARLDCSWILMSMPSITSLSRFFPSPVFSVRETCSKSTNCIKFLFYHFFIPCAY